MLTTRALFGFTALLLATSACLRNQPGLESPEISKQGVVYLSAFTPDDRSYIETTLSKGLPVFKLVDGQATLIRDCYYPAIVTFVSAQPASVSILADSETQLRLNALDGLATGGLHLGSMYSVHFTMVGEWQSDVERVDGKNLMGQCADAELVGTSFGAGAFETYRAVQQSGDAGVRAPNVGGVEFAHRRGYELTQTYGELSKCKVTTDEAGPPSSCNGPIHARLQKIEYTQDLAYYFNTGVVGEMSSDPSLSDADVSRIADTFAKELQTKAQSRGIQIAHFQGDPGESSAPKDMIECRILATKATERAIECRNGNEIIVQKTADPNALRSIVADVAEEVILSVDGHVQPPTTGPTQVVLLVDMSPSMVVNDADTYLTEDARKSHRYQITSNIMSGLLNENVDATVGVVPFMGRDCLEPIQIDGANMWSLTDASQVASLQQLERMLVGTPPRCENDDTDITYALDTARTLLQSKSGIVILVTDGAHNAPIIDGRLPKDAAIELSDSATLAVIRLERKGKGVEELRRLLAGPQGDAVASRWSIQTQNPRDEHVGFLEAITEENAGGIKLIDDLAGARLAKFILSPDDNLLAPMLMVHRELLPLMGSSTPVDAVRCDAPDVIVTPKGSKKVIQECKIRVTRAEKISVRYAPSTCVDSVNRAFISDGDGLHQEIKVKWSDGSTLIFDDFTIPGTPDLVQDAIITVEATSCSTKH